MTALEFEGTLGPDGMLKVPQNLAAQLQAVPSFRVLLLVPTEVESAEEEDKAWANLTEREFFRGYAESDAIYDDP